MIDNNGWELNPFMASNKCIGTSKGQMQMAFIMFGLETDTVVMD